MEEWPKQRKWKGFHQHSAKLAVRMVRAVWFSWRG